jgi:hypothetical protein
MDARLTPLSEAFEPERKVPVRKIAGALSFAASLTLFIAGFATRPGATWMRIYDTPHGALVERGLPPDEWRFRLLSYGLLALIAAFAFWFDGRTSERAVR